MAIGDVWEFTLIGEMQGQPIQNIFHYETSVEPGSEIQAKDLIEAWVAGTLQTLFLLNFGGAYVLQAYTCRRIYNGATLQQQSLPVFQRVVNSPGTLGADPVPSLSTVNISYATLLGPDEVSFRGNKFLSAGTEFSTNDGQADLSLIATLNSWMDELVLSLDVASGNVVVFGVWSQLNADFLDPTVFLPVSTFAVRLNLGGLIRRRQGSRRGGFQP